MKIYQSRYDKLPGSSYDEVVSLARKEYQYVKKLTKRQPYVRSSYFTKNKIFLALFWEHLAQKHRAEKTRRLKLYLCALDLLRHSKYPPETIAKTDDLNLLLHRFTGLTKDGGLFCVQVKEDKRSGRKDFMSVFSKSSPK